MRKHLSWIIIFLIFLVGSRFLHSAPLYGKSVSARNLISEGSSFETGFGGYGVNVYSLSGKKPYIGFSNDSVQGKKSLMIVKGKGDNVVIRFQGIPLKAGEQYTLSFSARGKPGGRVYAYLWGIPYYPRPMSKGFSLKKTWQRFSLTGKIPERVHGDKNLYQARISFSPQTTEMWLDAVQLEEGNLSAYEYPKPLELGVSSNAPANRFYPGVTVIAKVKAYAESGFRSPTLLEWTIYDYFGKEVKKGQYRLSGENIRGTHLQIKVPLLRTKGRNLYKAVFKINSGNLQDKAELIFAVLNKRKISGFAPDSPFGISGGLGYYYSQWQIPNPSHRAFIDYKNDVRWTPEMDLNLLVDMGIKWVRPFNLVRWKEEEIKKGEFIWHDKQLEEYLKRGFLVMPILGNANRTDFAPKWARTDKQDMDTSFKDHHPKPEFWRRYIYKTVQHFRGKIPDWEIINEPSSGLAPKTYVKLLKIAYQAARKADPKAKVVGIVCSNLTYIKAVARLGGLKYMDILSVHYLSSVPPDYTRYKEFPRVGELVKKIRSVLKQYGRGDMPIIDSESGGYIAPTYYSDIEVDNKLSRVSDHPVIKSQRMAAAYHIRGTVIQIGEGLKRSFIFPLGGRLGSTIVTNGSSPQQALLEFNGTPRATVIAYQAMTALLSGKGKWEKIPGAGRVNGYIFRREGKAVAILWSRDNEEIPLSWKSAIERVKILNILGYPLKLRKRNEIILNWEPIYIQGSYPQVSAFLKSMGYKRREQIKIARIRVIEKDKSPFLLVTARNEGDKNAEARLVLDKQPAFWGVQGKSEEVGLAPGEERRWLLPVGRGLGIGGGEDNEVVAKCIGRKGKVLAERKDRVWILRAGPALGKMNIDGVLGKKEWAQSEVSRLDLPSQVKVGQGKWQGIKDCSATIMAKWDESNLYLGIQVRDNRVISMEKGSNIYMKDAVEIFLDSGLKEGELPRYTGRQFQIVINPGERIILSSLSGHSLKMEAIKYAVRRIKSGYILEMAIPWKSLKFSPTEGGLLGFDLAIDDADKEGGNLSEMEAERKQMVWSGTATDYRDPLNFGGIFLVK